MDEKNENAVKAIETAIAAVNEIIQEDIAYEGRTTKGRIEVLSLLHDARETIVCPNTFGYCY